MANNEIKELSTKINICTSELNSLIHKLNIELLSLEREEVVLSPIVEEVETKIEEVAKVKNETIGVQLKKESDSNRNETSLEQFVVSPTQVDSDTSNKYESWVGKNLMNILASILIFVSFISFSSILLPVLGNTAKLILMFLVSFAFTGVGLFLQKKEKENKFYLSITSCGFGAIYISLILSYSYFKVINHFVLYGLILAWIVVLNKMNSDYKIFKIIAQLGIFISVSLTLSGFNDYNKFTQYFFILYILTTEIVLLIKNTKDSVINNIFYLLIMLTLTPIVEGVVGLTILLTAGIVIAVAYNLIKEIKYFTLLTSSYILILFALLYSFDFGGLPFSLLLLSLLIAFNLKGFYNTKFENILLFIYVFNIFTYTEYFTLSSDLDMNIWYYISFLLQPLSAIIFTYIGYIKDRYYYKISVPIILFTWVISNPNSILICLIAILAIIGVGYLLNRNYNISIKLLIYLSLYYMLFKFTWLIFSDFKYFELIMLIIISLYNLAFIVTPLSKNWCTRENEKISKAIGDIINLHLMCTSLLYYRFGDYNFIALTILTILTIALFSVNSVSLVSKNSLCSIYVGLKYTLLIGVVLNAFKAVSFLSSISFFIFAIACLLYGFNKQIKGLRTYSLALAIFSVIKLLLLDITYTNSLTKTLSFFICGLMCFGISMIYNKIGKKQIKRG